MCYSDNNDGLPLDAIYIAHMENEQTNIFVSLLLFQLMQMDKI